MTTNRTAETVLDFGMLGEQNCTITYHFEKDKEEGAQISSIFILADDYPGLGNFWDNLPETIKEIIHEKLFDIEREEGFDG